MKRYLVKLLFTFALVLALTIPFAIPAYADTSDDITITATPVFIGISVSPDSWTINDGGDDKIRKNTEYYATDTNDDTEPSNPVVDGDCLFTLTNSSTVATDITLVCPNFTGGDAWTNADSKSNGASAFAMLSYFTGDSWTNFASSGVIVKTTGSDVGKSNLTALTNIQFGIGFLSPTGDPTSGTSQSGTITVSAVEYTP